MSCTPSITASNRLHVLLAHRGHGLDPDRDGGRGDLKGRSPSWSGAGGRLFKILSL